MRTNACFIPTLLVLAALLICAPSALADTAAQAMGRAQNYYVEEKYAEAVGQLREAMVAVWNQAPLIVTETSLAADPPDETGAFTPREGNMYDAGQPIILVCDLIGPMIRTEGGLFLAAVKSELTVVDDEGRVRSGPLDVGAQEVKSTSPITEFPLTITFNLQGAPSGSYTLKVRLMDTASDKSASFEQPFVVR